MSSIGAMQDNSYMINMLQGGQYQLMQDPDGAGPAPVQVSVLDEEEINAKLEEMGAGFRIQNGQAVALDGFTPVSDSHYVGQVSTDPSDQPAIPPPSGLQMPPDEVRNLVGNMNSEEISDAALMWLTISEMSKGLRQEAVLARDQKRLAQDMKAFMKEASVNATLEKIQAERDNAALMFAVSCAVAVATCVAAGFSSGAATAIQAVGQCVTQGMQWASKEFWFQRKADDKQIEAMRLDAQAEIIDGQIEDIKGRVDQIREDFKKLWKDMEDYYESRKQIDAKIFQ